MYEKEHKFIIERLRFVENSIENEKDICIVVPVVQELIKFVDERRGL